MNDWILKRFDFLVSDNGFKVSEISHDGVDYSSSIVRISVAWYREPGIYFWVLTDSFWIRPADPRTFHLEELVRLKNPFAVFPLSRLEEDESVRRYLEDCAMLLLEYGKDILTGSITACEDVLIQRG